MDQVKSITKNSDRLFTMTNGWLVVIFLIIGASCREPTKALSEIPMGIEGSTEYTKAAYDSMQLYYQSDSTFNALLMKDKDEDYPRKLKMLITTPYADRYSTGLKDVDIYLMIHAARLSQKTLKEFEQIKKSIPRYNSDSVRVATDSLIKRLEEITGNAQVE